MTRGQITDDEINADLKGTDYRVVGHYDGAPVVAREPLSAITLNEFLTLQGWRTPEGGRIYVLKRSTGSSVRWTGEPGDVQRCVDTATHQCMRRASSHLIVGVGDGDMLCLQALEHGDDLQDDPSQLGSEGGEHGTENP